MTTLTIELPDFLQKHIETLAIKEGFTVSQFVIAAAGEKLAALTSLETLRREAAEGRKEDFVYYLDAVPDISADENDSLC
ncbi:MAG: toxin-antitoxin system HicB family antitoxin [Methylococcaceae bacterium]|nr:MAG: toxin-antitoxin system HicB family antitoxin [Methylococcaceae bacterium]